MTRQDDHRAACATLTYLTEPADSTLGRLLQALSPAARHTEWRRIVRDATRSAAVRRDQRTEATQQLRRADQLNMAVTIS